MSLETKKKWLKVVQTILQAVISALTALGVTSCTVG
jgi:hypothetical protein